MHAQNSRDHHSPHRPAPDQRGPKPARPQSVEQQPTPQTFYEIAGQLHLFEIDPRTPTPNRPVHPDLPNLVDPALADCRQTAITLVKQLAQTIITIDTLQTQIRMAKDDLEFEPDDAA